MARFLSAELTDTINRPNTRLATHSTLELSIIIGAETQVYRFATATLNIGGATWLPQLRQTAEINSDLSSEGDEVSLNLQNVDSALGIEFVALQQFLFGAEAVVGRVWKDLDRGAEWHEVLLTGLVVGLEPDEMMCRLTVVPDVYSGVSVGPLRKIRRLCAFLYKGRECGRPATDPPTCDLTLHGAGGCHGRWGDPNKFVRHGGEPFIDTNLELKII